MQTFLAFFLRIDYFFFFVLTFSCMCALFVKGHHTPAAATIQPLEVLTYLLIATVATYYTYEHGIAHDMLEYVLSRDPTALQQGMLCIGVWLAYVACVLVVFYRSAKLIRR